jgi:exodeoxyribonuclease V
MTINYVTGYAGTGKSHKLLQLLRTLNPATSVCLAPTHKALQRLQKVDSSGLELRTIHSLLGWIPGINEDAKSIEHIETTIKMDRDISEYCDIVIDEAGMMNEEMLTTIVSKLEEANSYETDHITIHLFLDPYQLLPVKGRQIQTDPTTTFNLTEQHRAESPDVVALFTKFVNYLEGTNKLDLSTPESDNVVMAKSLEGFQKGDRLLAYTNDAVGNWNRKIAKHLGIDSYIGQEVQLGSSAKTLVVHGFVQPSLAELLELYHNDMLIMQNTQINKNFLEESLNALLRHNKIDFIRHNDYILPVICGIGHAATAHRLAKEAAIQDRKNFTQVYALGRAFTMDYTFASTVHKAQGSEFDTVWIDKANIQKSIFNGSYNNYARLMYVATSRARVKINII